MDVPDRQRTLRATVAWSHDLLDDDERALLARLSVCAGGATIDTAEAVGAGDDDLDVPEVLSSLVGHSLVTPTDTVRGRAALPDARGRPHLRRRAAPGARRGDGDARAVGRPPGHGQRGRRGRPVRARPAGCGRPGWTPRPTDLQEAVRWAVAADRAELAVALTAPLARWWWARGLLVPMAADRRRDRPVAVGGRARPGVGRPAPVGARHDAHRARPHRRGGAAARRGRRRRPRARRPVAAGPRAGRAGDDPTPGRPRARRRCSTRRWRHSGAAATPGRWPSPSSPTATSRCWPATSPAAVRAHEEALALARGIGDDHLVATLLDQLGLDALMAGDAATARAAARRRRPAAAPGDRRPGGAGQLPGRAGRPGAAAGRRRRPPPGCAAPPTPLRTTLGVAVWPLLQSLVTGLADGIRAPLGDDDDRRECAAGAAMDPWDALDAGLAQP